MAETLYGTQEDSHSLVMSERVQSLASCIYREFEGMIVTYGDNVIKGLMPHIVSVLENLNQAYREKQDHEVEIELLRVENDNLKKQFEKEKNLRKNSEQKYLEGDDLLEEERKAHRVAVEAMESNQRRLEVKSKNLQEQILRNEEREAEMKGENSKLHLRYTELLKTHADYVERYKLQTDKDVTSPNRSVMPFASLRHVPNSVIYTELNTKNDQNFELQLSRKASDDQGLIHKIKNQRNSEPANDRSVNTESDLNAFKNKDRSIEKDDSLSPESVDERRNTQKTNDERTSDVVNETQTPQTKEKQNPEINNASPEKDDFTDGSGRVDAVKERQAISWVADEGSDEWVQEEANDDNVAKCLVAPYSRNILSLTSGELEDENTEGIHDDPSTLHSSSSARLQKMSSIYDELVQQDSNAPGEVDGGITLAGVTAEVEKLIRENNELLETKNALNVVKDDLITRVDDLLGEQELLREELTALQTSRDKQSTHISDLEDELKRVKEEIESIKAKVASDNEDDDKRCFTRIDMARVVMERNQFKEKLMELQEAVRLAEMIRASKEHPDLIKGQKKKSSFWNFFSGLLNSNDEPPPPSPLPRQTPKKPSTPSSTKPPTVI